ncbi:MAG: ABC transporter ATP-binding protein [Acidobacteriia bacterium]|nr:ABC transporter ATP-binding protein [Terriglobia bacterium]
MLDVGRAILPAAGFSRPTPREPHRPPRCLTNNGGRVPTLEVRDLTKYYTSIPAVESVSFAIRPHEVLGYLGPNGSGKTTTVNMLTGLLEPTRGHIYFDGRDVRANLMDYKRAIGYVPEVPYIYPYLTGREYLQLIGRLRSLNQRATEQKITDLLQLFAMHPHRHSLISSYSKGMKQKILICAALLHNPQVLIFDEPLSGLDVTSALVFKNLVKSLSAAGKIILYSSHVLEVVEKVCSSVIILHQGHVVADDSVESLRNLMQLPSLEQIFAQLVVEEDAEQVANHIVEVMSAHA